MRETAKISILYISELSLIYLYKFCLLTNPNNNLPFLTPNSHSHNIFVSLFSVTNSFLGIKPIKHTILIAIIGSIREFFFFFFCLAGIIYQEMRTN